MAAAPAGQLLEGGALSVNTVKSHIRSIYTKLGVSSRRTAVLSAHERSTHPASTRADHAAAAPAQVATLNIEK
jgi:hypothetical protein